MHSLVQIEQASHTQPSAESNDAKQQLVERLLSHYEAGTSATEPGPAARQLRAQICSLGLLSRNVKLPDRLLASSGAQQVGSSSRMQVRFAETSQHRSTAFVHVRLPA